MSPDRPLPTLIGPTENALRALLSKTLSSTAITSYTTWVVINAASGADPDVANESWQNAVADALKVELIEVTGIVRDLYNGGLLDESGTLTELGAAELASARSAVRAATLRLVEGIDEVQQQTARRVLDHIRNRAEALLGA